MNFPNYPDRRVHGVRVQYHKKVTGYAAVMGDIVPCSMIDWDLILADMPNWWCIHTWLAGIWCDVDNTAWLNQAFGNQSEVLRGELEPSNGWCVCHGRSGAGNASPDADPNSILMSTAEGLLAGHVQKDAAAEMAQSGLTAMFRSNGAAPAECQMLAITDPSRVAAGPGPRPCAIGLDIYVFSRPTNMAVFTPAMNNLAASLAQLQAPYQNVGGHSAAPVALATVPGQIQAHEF